MCLIENCFKRQTGRRRACQCPSHFYYSILPFLRESREWEEKKRNCRAIESSGLEHHWHSSRYSSVFQVLSSSLLLSSFEKHGAQGGREAAMQAAVGVLPDKQGVVAFGMVPQAYIRRSWPALNSVWTEQIQTESRGSSNRRLLCMQGQCWDILHPMKGWLPTHTHHPQKLPTSKWGFLSENRKSTTLEMATCMLNCNNKQRNHFW